MSYNPPLISGPIAPENNPPINPDYYVPRVFYISAIVEGSTTLITTTLDHNYVIGQTIRLTIPAPYGARGLNEQQGNVLSIPAPNQVIVSINSQGFQPFNGTPIAGLTPPQIMPIGDINNGTINTTILTNFLGQQGIAQTGCFIPGSFIDVSPSPGNTADLPTP